MAHSEKTFHSFADLATDIKEVKKEENKLKPMTRFSTPSVMKKREKPKELLARIETHSPTTDILKTLKDAIRNKEKVLFGVSVSPETAMDLLTTNLDKNRSITWSRVWLYTHDMEADRWQTNGTMIRVTKKGVLIDGQKRLLSVIYSGKTILFDFYLGLDENVVETIDIGETRTGSHTFEIAGIKNPRVAAAAVKNLIYFKRHGVVAGAVKGATVTNHDLMEWKDTENIKLLSSYVEKAIKELYVKRNFLTASQWAFFLFLLGTRPGSRQAAEEFLYALANGENISRKRNSAIFFLQEKLINWDRDKNVLRAGKRTKHMFSLKAKYIITAWNHHVSHDDIGDLRIDPEASLLPKPLSVRK